MPGGHWKGFRRGGVVLALLVTMASGALAVVAGPAGAQQVDTVDLTAVAGTPIAQGTNSQSVGFLNLKTYRVEELTLPQATSVAINGQTVTVSTAWRVVVSGGPFVVRDLPATIWIDDVAVGFGQESVDLSELSVVIFDSALLRDGATLAVSYQSQLDRTELPERLSLT